MPKLITVNGQPFRAESIAAILRETDTSGRPRLSVVLRSGTQVLMVHHATGQDAEDVMDVHHEIACKDWKQAMGEPAEEDVTEELTSLLDPAPENDPDEAAMAQEALIQAGRKWAAELDRFLKVSHAIAVATYATQK